MTSEKAPKRIWAGPNTTPTGPSWTYGDWDIDDGDSIEYAEHSTQYIRHDLHLARIEKLEREKLEAVAAAYEDAAAAMAHPTDAQAALAARDKRVREEALRVKPLVWSGRGAFCDFGVWQIVTDDDGDFGYRFSGSPNVVFWHWKTEEEAKDAAQADRERRILSALIEGDTDD